MPATRLWNRCSGQPFAHASSIPEGTAGLPAGLMPSQGADHAQRMAGAGTTDLLIRRIYRASTGKGVAQPCRTMSLRAPATVALRENVWRSRIPFRPGNAGPSCCRWRKSGSGWRTSTRTPARPCCGRSRASSRPCSSNSRFSPRTTTSTNKPPRSGHGMALTRQNERGCGRVAFSGVSRNTFTRAETAMLRDDSGHGSGRPNTPRNVLGDRLEVCSINPMTGFFRDGCCDTEQEDVGSHTVCAVMTAAFLAFSKSCGNDLSTPVPEFGFRGLKPGDRWCLCAPRWQEALEAGQAPRVVLRATHEGALDYCTLADLKRFAVDLA